MKNLLFLIASMLLTSISFAQVKPEAFIGMLPGIPKNVCSMKQTDRDMYIAKIDSIKELIENERARRDSDMDANADTYEKQAMEKVSQQYGLSQQDIQKLKNKKEMTKEEKDEIINKALKKSGNISLDEVKKLKKMNKEEKAAWGAAYGADRMAEAQSDPKKYQDQQLENKNMYELTAMQKAIIDSLTAVETKFGKQYTALDSDPEAKVMLDNIKKWESEVFSLMGEVSKADMKRMDELGKKIKSEKTKYCNKYTPGYLDFLIKYEDYTKSCLPACYRLERISTHLTKIQTGVEMKQEPGLIGIGKVADYLKFLRGVFKYNLMNETD
jgi:hypothetical protein